MNKVVSVSSNLQKVNAIKSEVWNILSDEKQETCLHYLVSLSLCDSHQTKWTQWNIKKSAQGIHKWILLAYI